MPDQVNILRRVREKVQQIASIREVVPVLGKTRAIARQAEIGKSDFLVLLFVMVVIERVTSNQNVKIVGTAVLLNINVEIVQRIENLPINSRIFVFVYLSVSYCSYS